MITVVSDRIYDAASDPGTGISGRLTGEIIRHTVDDDGFSDDLTNGKAFVIKSKPGVALVSEQRNHVPGMIRVFLIRWIVVSSGCRKRRHAFAGFVDMESIEIR